MVEIGVREGVGKRYVSRIIRLAFLAPAIVESIAEGRQPPELTAQYLSTGRGDRPLSWQAQENLARFRRASRITPSPRKWVSGRFQCFRIPSIAPAEFLRDRESAEVHRQSGQWRERAKIAEAATRGPSLMHFNREQPRVCGTLLLFLR
jgi:hypothetical protein